jgi:hypothetical protein
MIDHDEIHKLDGSGQTVEGLRSGAYRAEVEIDKEKCLPDQFSCLEIHTKKKRLL